MSLPVERWAAAAGHVVSSVGSAERHADSLQWVKHAATLVPVHAIVGAVREEVETAVEPEATAVFSGAVITSRVVQIHVKGRELLTVLVLPKHIYPGVSCVATEANEIVVALRANIEVAVLGVAVSTVRVKHVDT